MSADPKAEKMKEIKTILRSLLVARANTTTTIEQLNGLYRDEEETNIPFHEFGYKRLDDFLMNMPDTLRVFVDHNNRVCVRFVASEASAHVASLVSRQRKPPTRRAPSLGYRSSGYRHFSQRTHNFPRPPATAPRNFNNAPPNLSNRLPDLSVLSNILVRGREYLRSIRSNRGIRKTELMGEMNKVLKGQPYTIPNLNVQLEALASKHNIKVENDLVYFKDMIAPPASTSNINESRASSSIEHKATERHETSQPSQSINQNNGEYKPGENYRQDQSVKSQPLTNGYHSLEPDRNVCLDTNSNYKEHENYEQHNGRTSSTEEFQLYVASSMLTDRTRIRLQKLLQDHPEGIWCTELPSLYKNEYLVSLEYADLGFSNITEFVNAFPDVFSVSDPMQNNRLMVTDATMPNRNQQSSHPKKTMAAAYNIEEYVQPEPDPVPVRLSTNVTQSLIPDGVMSINEILEQIEVGSLIYEEYLEVHVSEIFTPSFFWIQLRKNKKKLTALMTHLQEYYTDPDLRLHSYKIPQVVLEPGLNVACKYGKDWHRGMIKKVRPDGFAIVWFYDYGTVKSYNPNDLYFLHKRFSSLPAQAIACSLFNVKPIGSTEWAFTSTDPFVNKIWEIPMAALIADIDEERNSMTVSLVDVSDDQEDLHINDWLVENGYAEYGKMEDCPPLHKLHLFEEQMIIRMKDEERMRLKLAKRQKREMQRENDYLNYIERRESSIPSPCPSSMADSLNATKLAASNKENMDLMNLMKQTNTITQAILLTTCSKKNSNHANGYISDSPSMPVDSVRNFGGTSCESLDNQGKMSELNNKFSSMKLNLFDRRKNCYGSNDSMTNYSPRLESNYDFKSSMQSVNSSHPSYRDESIPAQHANSIVGSFSRNYESNNINERPSSVNSMYSQRNCNFNPNMRVKEEIDADDVDFKDGTLTFKVKIEPDTSSNYGHSEYLPRFPDINMNKVDADGNLDIKKEDIKREIIHEADEGYHTAAPSRSQTLGSLSLTNSVSTAPSTPSAFTVTHVGKDEDLKSVHIFHIDNEGWISADEFVDAFTNLKDQRIMFKLLEVLEYQVNYKHVTRDSDPQLFSQLDLSFIKVPRGLDQKISPDYVLILMPLKSMLQVLDKLDFLNAKMLREAVPLMKKYKKQARDILFDQFQNEILFDALNLLLEYKEFRISLVASAQ